MTIAITGATSMLGTAAIKECVKQNITVIAFCRKDSKNIYRIPISESVKVIECDLDKMKDFSVQEFSADVFIHLGWAFTDKAGRNNSKKQLINVQYTLDAVELSKRLGCTKFIGAGSQAEYGIPNMILKDNTSVDPIVPYGVAKYAAGKLSRIECKKFAMAHIWVRVLSVYGMNDSEQTLIKQLIKNAHNDIPMKLSTCKQKWDYLFEDDAGRAFIDIARRGIDGRVYNLASGVSRPLEDFVNDVIAVVNPDYNKAEFGKYPYNKTQPFILQADITELTKDTGWQPKVEFTEGIRMIAPPPHTL